MADLTVQPKKKPNYVPLILLAIGLVLLIWFLTRNRDTNTPAAGRSDTTTARATPAIRFEIPISQDIDLKSIS